jgi:hypothetical protein
MGQTIYSETFKPFETDNIELKNHLVMVGEPKYHRLGRTYELAGQNMPTDEHCSKLLARLEEHDVVVRMGW